MGMVWTILTLVFAIGVFSPLVIGLLALPLALVAVLFMKLGRQRGR